MITRTCNKCGCVIHCGIQTNSKKVYPNYYTLDIDGFTSEGRLINKGTTKKYDLCYKCHKELENFLNEKSEYAAQDCNSHNMKIIVDCLPESSKDCLFSDVVSEYVSPKRYICRLSNEICTYKFEDKECPFLKSLKEQKSNSDYDYDYDYDKYEYKMRKLTTKDLLDNLCALGGEAYDIVIKILKERGAV